jgi:hypothetical protein
MGVMTARSRTSTKPGAYPGKRTKTPKGRKPTVEQARRARDAELRRTVQNATRLAIVAALTAGALAVDCTLRATGHLPERATTPNTWTHP